MACGCALIDAIQTVTAVPVLLKWPNDVIIDRQHSWGKLAGMLSEVGLESGQPSVLVVGIGVNVNVQRDLLPQLAPNATSLLVEAGHSVDRLLLLDAFLTAAQQYIDALRDGVDVMQSWQRNLAWMGQPVVITTPDCSVEGVAESVDSDGALILVMPDGSRSRFTVGDVSLRPC
jgi:BirA family biotin operon repressor/biotin-[acetyl-CoA-carboxylase] ligase